MGVIATGARTTGATIDLLGLVLISVLAARTAGVSACFLTAGVSALILVAGEDSY